MTSRSANGVDAGCDFLLITCESIRVNVIRFTPPRAKTIKRDRQRLEPNEVAIREEQSLGGRTYPAVEPLLLFLVVVEDIVPQLKPPLL